MAHAELNNHINQLIYKRDRVLATTPPEFAVYFINYYESAINHLVDCLVDLA